MERPSPEGMQVQQCGQVLQALPPGWLKINFAALLVLALAVPRLPPYAPSERELPNLSPNSLPRHSALADGQLQLMETCGPRVQLGLEMDCTADMERWVFAYNARTVAIAKTHRSPIFGVENLDLPQQCFIGCWHRRVAVMTVDRHKKWRSGRHHAQTYMEPLRS